jgi:hypothetical protein
LLPQIHSFFLLPTCDILLLCRKSEWHSFKIINHAHTECLGPLMKSNVNAETLNIYIWS